MLLNAAKFQDHGFYRFWVTKRKPTEGGGGGVKLPTSPKLNVNYKTFIKRLECYANILCKLVCLLRHILAIYIN